MTDGNLSDGDYLEVVLSRYEDTNGFKSTKMIKRSNNCSQEGLCLTIKCIRFQDYSNVFFAQHQIVKKIKKI